MHYDILAHITAERYGYQASEPILMTNKRYFELVKDDHPGLLEHMFELFVDVDLVTKSASVLAKGDETERQNALACLQRIGDGAIPVLERMLAAEDAELRVAAESYLSSLEGWVPAEEQRKAFPVFADDLCNSGPRYGNELPFEKILKLKRYRRNPIREWRRLLNSMLEFGSRFQRIACGDVLASMGAADSISNMEAAARKSRDEDVRCALCWATLKIVEPATAPPLAWDRGRVSQGYRRRDIESVSVAGAGELSGEWGKRASMKHAVFEALVSAIPLDEERDVGFGKGRLILRVKGGREVRFAGDFSALENEGIHGTVLAYLDPFRYYRKPRRIAVKGLGEILKAHGREKR